MQKVVDKFKVEVFRAERDPTRNRAVRIIVGQNPIATIFSDNTTGAFRFPDHDPENTLVISPSARDNIGLARRIVEAAPTFTGWHFLPAKPPKELERLTMELPGIDDAKVCGDDWVYRLTSYNRMEFFDIEVFTDYAGSISDSHLELLTRRLIECLVGEIHYLEKFAAVKVIRAAGVRPPEKLTALPSLRRHIAHLQSGNSL